MAQRQTGDRHVLQYVGRSHRQRQQIERQPAPEEAKQGYRQQQPASGGKRHVDGEPGRRVDEPRVRVEPVEPVEQRRRLNRGVPVPSFNSLAPVRCASAKPPGTGFGVRNHLMEDFQNCLLVIGQKSAI